MLVYTDRLVMLNELLYVEGGGLHFHLLLSPICHLSFAIITSGPIKETVL